MKIGFFEIEPWEKEVFQQAFPRDALFFSTKEATASTVRKDLEALSIFVQSKVTADVLQQLPRLRLIATRSTGFDHIDMEACRKRKIIVTNVPTYGEHTVAEQAFALILALSRKIIESVERTRKGSFELKGLRGFDLKGKTIGVVGCGNIGKHVVHIAKGFGMNVLVFDMFKDKKLARELRFRYVPLPALLQQSDILTLHVPYNKHTHHLLNKETFAIMKKNAVLINTSRGGVVDTDALVRALQKKQLAGAGLDVLEGESELHEERELLTRKFTEKYDLKTLLENHILQEMSNVIITPHNAFNTKEALLRILETTVENIQAFKKGRKVNVVG